MQSLILRSRLRWSVITSAALLLMVAGAIAQPVPRENPEEELRKRDREYDASLARPKASGNEEDVRGRQEWFDFQRRFPYDEIPAGARAEAIRQTKAMEVKLRESLSKNRAHSLLAAASWEPIGPDNVAGRIPTLAYHPTRAGVILVGGASGGVWKSTDNGVSWKTTFDKQSSLTVGALAYDYTDPDIIYAGTGENYPASEDYFGDGIFKSTDGGETWQNIGLNDVSGFSKIFVHRQNHSIVYAAVRGGFFRSDDGGEHWTKLLSTDCLDMTVNPGNSDQLMVATNAGISRSLDRGKSFQSITTGLNLNGVSRISVAMAPGDPKRAYALVARFPGQNGYNSAELYASTNGGDSWQMKKNLGGLFFRNQGYYNNFISVSPHDPLKVVMGGIDVFVSDDGCDVSINVTASYDNMGNPAAVHPDQHAVDFNPHDPMEILVGNDGGLYRSSDGGSTWHRVSLNLPITQFYKMDVDFSSVNRVYGGTQDNGTYAALNSGSGAKNWHQISGGDGFYVAADPITPGIVYSEIYYGTPIYRIDVSRPDEVIEIDEQISAERGDWSSPLIFSRVTGHLYSGRRHLFRTSDGGASWQQLNPNNSAFISAVGPSMLEEDKIVIGTAGGEVRYSVDDGAHWALSTGLPSSRRFVSDVRFDPVKAERVYAVVSGFGTGHVFRSENYGASFTDISGNLPNAPVNCIAIDPRNNEHLFVGTDAGAFVSLDAGATWLPFNEGLPLAPVVDMKIHEQSHMLIAATHGRSMFRIPIDVVQPSPVMITPVGGESFVAPLDLTVRWTGFSGLVTVWISYDNGRTYTKMANGVAGSEATIAVPLVKTAVARIKVEENGGRSLVSGTFALNPATNGTEVNKRGFIAEAIEVRGNYLWATSRGSDSLYKLKLPLLSAREGIARTNIPGHVRDMAYDSAADRFYLLVTADDYSTPKLYGMDTNGVGLGEIPLPAGIDRAAGVAMVRGAIALVTPGAQGEIFTIDTAGGLIARSGALQGASESDRRGLAWDGAGLLQGVVSGGAAEWFPSRLERVRIGAAPSVGLVTPVVLPTVLRLEFYGLAVDFTSAGAGKQVVWGTDTSGAFYKFIAEASGVDELPAAGRRSQGIALTDISPNPFRGETRVSFRLASAREVTLDLYRSNGERVLGVVAGRMEAGEQSVTIAAGDLPSGIYYAVLGDAEGERDVRPVVVLK